MAQPQVSFLQTKLKPDSFLHRKREVVRENTLLYQLDVLKKTGRYDAFKLQWHDSYSDEPDHWPVPNHLFWDSDVGKWIEAAVYFIHDKKNETIENAIHELVDMIRSAQQDDGYLNIHFTVVAPKERFTNFRDLHELYNAGHLIEAAVAHHDLYHNDKLIEPLVKYVDLFCKTLGPGEGQKHGYPGHPEIEIALIRLYEVTKDPKHLELAQYFIDERGNLAGQDGKHFYTSEAEARGERPYERPNYYPKPKSYWYNSAHKPILEQESVEGHSVRSMYLLTAVAALNKYRPRSDYQKALQRLWNNMVDKKMYLTGGIGAIKQWEGFSIEYFLPNGTDEGGCYSETCAAIGVMMLAERMLQIDLDSKYADIMELCLYNSMLCGMSTDGKRFTYVNQLASSDEDPDKKAAWYTCACCPPNVSRTLGFVSGYLVTTSHDSDKSANINVHIPAAGTTAFDVGGKVVKLDIDSTWPWDGKVGFDLDSAGVQTTIAIRIPEWSSSNWSISPKIDEPDVRKGYLHLPSPYLRSNSQFTINFPMTPRFIAPHPFTNQNVIALARGPLVYCLEDVDNDWVTDHFKSLLLNVQPHVPTVKETQVHDKVTGEDIVAMHISSHFSFLKVDGQGAMDGVALGTCAATEMSGGKKPSFTLPQTSFLEVNGDQKKEVMTPDGKIVEGLNFVPYYFRANREGRGHMRVGIRIGTS
ncbi:ER degradation-enhancing alpha-mannosidase-like protein 1 [Sphaceloma murrayae]|uniref:ER degradation-enhancing alpha-mannosidase-like protein 1 n=1 Tax=Sphaceloma murrayae TaxID=2082308 RepID=A0A2K1QI74_9PEZI|nr:ER degradation-enhancing alpha-mannosidase-like protein 1 [Sphaceloma murrayae]